MSRKTLRNIGIGCVAALWLALTAAAWLRPAGKISESERRPLAQLPGFAAEDMLSGDFMADFEDYTLDQFPLRDRFRQLKALVHYNVFGQRDNNGIYLVDGVAAKLEYPLDVTSVERALEIFARVHERYLQGTDCKVYFAAVPDKSYYLAPENGYPTMDYDVLFARLRQLSWAHYIDLADCLTAEDYYRTDTHWRQERLLTAATRLCDGMGTEKPGVYNEVIPEQPFYGVYYGQAALPMEPETITYLENEMLRQCTVYNYENGKTTAVYDMEKQTSRDLYDIFLSGAVALQRIDNPTAQTDRELIVFRDSFGSSMVPLLVQGYKTVTLVDLRYISPSLLEQYLAFEDQDVLFLYSTLVLNNASALKE